MRAYFKGTTRDGKGQVIPSATVTIYEAGSTTAASVYTTLTGTTAVNSVTADTDGTFEFYISFFDYDSDKQFKMVISKTGYTSVTWDYVTVDNVILGTYTIASDTTVSTNITIPKGVLLSPATGKTLTFTKQPIIGEYQVFTGAGSIAFTYSSAVVYAEWFGALGTGTDNDNPAWTKLAASITAGAEVYGVVGRTYYLNTADGLTFTNKVVLKNATFTTGATVGNAPTIVVAGANSIVENCKITGDATSWANDETTATELRRNLQIKGDRTKVINNEIVDGIIGIDVYTGTVDVEITGNYVHHTTVYSGEHDSYGASGCNYSDGIRMAGASRCYVAHNRVYGYGQNIAGGGDADRLIIHDNDCEGGDDNGIYLSSTTNVRVHHNRVKDFDSSGIKVRGSRQQIDHNIVSSPTAGAAGSGINITGNGTPDAGGYNGEDGIIDSNVVTGTFTGAGISVSEQVETGETSGFLDNFKIIGNTIRVAATNYGIKLAQGASTKGVVSNNTVAGQLTGLIIQSYSSYAYSGLIIDSNDFSGGAGHGIYVVGEMEYSKITNNVSRNSSGSNKNGIYLLKTTYCDVSYNDVRDTQTVATQARGIYEYTNSTNNFYFGNLCSGNATAHIDLESSTSRVVTNETISETLSGHRTIKLGEASVYSLDPGGSHRNIVCPTGTMPAGYTVFVVNTADNAENLVFDPTPGINVTVAQNKSAIFTHTGAAWRQVTTAAP